MKIITINLPERYLESIQTLVSLGCYPSRSEAIRVALYNFLTNELNIYKQLDSETFKMLIKSRGVKYN